MSRKHIFCMSLPGVFIVGASLGLAQDYDLSWHTIDGGGAFSVAGSYELGGTIGQSDAGPPPLSGGGFELRGGFWPAVVPQTPCVCPGDLNSDGVLDGDDVQEFVQCVLKSGGNCACADLNGSGAPDAGDVAAFVSALLTAQGCP